MQKIGIKVDDEIHQRIKEKCATFGTSFQELGQRWFMEWLEGSAEESPFSDLTKEERNTLLAVLEVLRGREYASEDPLDIKRILVEAGRRYATRPRRR